MSGPLFDRLDDGLRHAPEYRGGLSNHLPMALVALDAMGADGQRLCAFASDYARRLGPRRPGDPIDDAFEAAFARRLDAIGRDGVDAVLREALPRLIPGVGAAAFHGLIRTAYGVIAGHAGEIAAGLAYWETRFLPLLPVLPQDGDEADVGRWLAALCASLPPSTSAQGLIFQRMAQ